MKKRIFVVHSSYQVYLAALIVKQQTDTSFSVILCEGNCGEISEDNWDQIINLPLTNGRWFGYELNKLVRSSISQIFSNLRLNQGDEIFLSDLDWPLNNYLLKYVNEVGVECKLFEDGSGIYIPHKLNIQKYIKMLLKLCLAIPRLSLYAYYIPKHYLGISHKLVKEVYSFREVNNGIINNILIIRPSYNNSTTAAQGVLILDQPWHRVLNQDTCDLLLGKFNKFIDECKRQRISDFRIKRHPRDPFGVDSIFKELPSNFKVVDSSDCAETYIVDNMPQIVVSTYSTALLNIKDLYPEIRVVSIALLEHEIQGIQNDKVNFSELDKLFRKYQIEMIK
ncbi:MAG: hypothetical protein KAJ63_07080 [Methyloprofundus sp.]|nr:hypothetical protein [Methyloprofundus sp.]